ncbi:MAG: HK97 family phage prohead protease [Vicinamibacteria bacterium]|nr:HK97 family phage prohead protease [Vicinamibacteria bacterium]
MDFERRFVTVDALRLERRAEGGGATLVGYAALFGSLSVNLGGFREQIEPGAFKESISEDDIRSLFNHDEDHVLGRLANKTLRLAEDAKGLRFENDLPDTQTARDLATLIERGDVSQMSFAFRVKPNGDRWDEDPELGLVRTLTAVRLRDVGPVTFPAYPDTGVAVRSLDAWRQTQPAVDRRRRLRLAELD